MTRLFPRFFEQEEGEEIFNTINASEIRDVLDHFKKDKSPGPDGWTVEFIVCFFELFEKDLVALVDDIRVNGKVPGILNATFIALIPKTDKPLTFDDFRPISLCNLVYKIITKILSNRMKPILSKRITKEQFGFLLGRHISEAVGITQEALHTIKT